MNGNAKDNNQKPKKKKTRFLSLIFIAVLFIATAVYIAKEFDIKTLYGEIARSENKEYLIGAFALMAVFFAGFAIFIRMTAKALDIKISRFRSIIYSFTDFFYTSATPAGCGSPAGTAYAISQDNIPASASSAMTILYVIFFRFALIIYGIGAGFLVFSGKLEVEEFFRILFIVGGIFSIFLTLMFCAMLFFTRLTKVCGVFLIKIGAKLHIIKNYEKTKKRFTDSLEDYREAAKILRSDKKLIFKQLSVALIQRAALFAVSYMVYRSFGLGDRGFLYIFFLQVAVAVAVDNLPLPGGIGVNEYAFFLLYGNLYPEDELAAAAMILTRAICYYLPLLFTSLVTLSREIIYNMRAKRTEKQ